MLAAGSAAGGFLRRTARGVAATSTRAAAVSVQRTSNAHCDETAGCSVHSATQGLSAGPTEVLGPAVGRAEPAQPAQQSIGLLQLPDGLQAAIAAFIARSPRRQVRQDAARLSGALRQRARLSSAHRAPRGPAAAATSAAAAEEEEERSWEPLAAAADERRLGVVPDAPAGAAPHAPRYREPEVAAYIAARMPATYAALHRVMREVALRLPAFSPSSMVDFGSGPGTAIWSAMQAWPGQLRRVAVVESSAPMSQANATLLQGASGAPPQLRYFSHVDTLSRKLRGEDRQFDAVVAAYALSELPSTEARDSMDRLAPSLLHKDAKGLKLLECSGLMGQIIIESGNPFGSTVVREAREHVLRLERKATWQAPAQQLHGRDNTDGQHGPQDVRQEGAHIVAPCAHDGSCPMDRMASWCYFRQRLLRTPAQKMAKRGLESSPQAHEDENFSFVVIRRGVRPQSSGPYEVNPEDEPAISSLAGVPSPRGQSLPVPEVEMPLEEPKSESGEAHEHAAVVDAASTDTSGQVTVTSSEQVEDEDEEDGGGEEEGGGHGARDSQAAVSTGWARVVRPPLRRGGHVILDVCAAADAGGRSGALVRSIVSRGRGGSARYRRARHTRWGDLWPLAVWLDDGQPKWVDKVRRGRHSQRMPTRARLPQGPAAAGARSVGERRGRRRVGVGAHGSAARESDPDEGWIGGPAAGRAAESAPPGTALPVLGADLVPLLLQAEDSHYLYLGVPPTAGVDEIKAAFRRLSKQYHPDATTLPLEVAAAKFVRLKEAHSVLTSPERRRLYDWQTAQEASRRQATARRPPPRPTYYQQQGSPDQRADELGRHNMPLSNQAQAALAFDVFALLVSLAAIAFAVLVKGHVATTP
eukprot:SM000013S26505  [mRNA]  locus=s13:770355:775052:- [translate_table: standard]